MASSHLICESHYATRSVFVTGLQAAASTLLDAAHWLGVSIVCTLLVMAVATIFRRKLPQQPGTLALALFLVFVAGGALLADAHGYAGRVPRFSGFAPALFGLFFYFYADRRYLSARGRWLGLLYTVTVIGAIGRSTNASPSVHLPSLLVQSLVFVGDILTVIVLCSGLIPQVYRRIIRPLPPSERSRLFWPARFGSTLTTGFVILLLAVAVSPPDAATPVPPVTLLVVRTAILTPLTLLPVVAAFALALGQRYDRMALVRRATIYGTQILILATIYAAAFIVIHLLYAQFLGLPASFELDLAAPFLTLMALLLIAIYRPLRPWIQDRLDQRFFPQAHVAASALAAFQEALREPRSLADLCDLLTATVRRAVASELVMLWGRVSSSEAARLAGRGTAATVNERRLIQLLEQGDPNTVYLQQLSSYPEEHAATSATHVARAADVSVAALAVRADDPFSGVLAAEVGAVPLDTLPSRSIVARALLRVGAALAVPLALPAGTVGLLAAGPREDGARYSSDDRAFFDTFVELATPALHEARIRQARETDEHERERVDQELRTAQRIQQALLPKETPALAGWRIATYYQPAREVGGDFYDFLPLSDGRLGLVIGDVSGKGIPAALVMATTRSMLRAVAETASHVNAPGAVLRRVNQLLCADLPGNMFVTCLYGLLDPASGTFHFANAGQDLPALWRRDGNVCELRATGMPLGLMPESEYEERDVMLEPGASMLLYSDGLVEAHNPRREMFGFARLTGALGERHEDGAAIAALLRDLTAFAGAAWEQEDDITLVTVGRLEEQEEEPHSGAAVPATAAVEAL